MDNLLTSLSEWALSTGIKILIAAVLFVVSFKLINSVTKKLEKTLTEKFDKTITKTLLNGARILGKIVVVMSLVGYLGIDTSGITAVVTSLGVCVGLAVNGALSNLAGGLLIILTRPFKIGDYITAQGYDGTVEDINIISTKIVTVDNKVVYIPNGALSAGNIMNYSEKNTRRVDFTFSIGSNDPELVKRTLLDIAASNPYVLKSPEVFARVSDFGAGRGTIVTFKAWATNANYWDAYHSLLEEIQRAFNEKNIVIPFNQLDVHIKDR